MRYFAFVVFAVALLGQSCRVHKENITREEPVVAETKQEVDSLPVKNIMVSEPAGVDPTVIIPDLSSVTTVHSWSESNMSAVSWTQFNFSYLIQPVSLSGVLQNYTVTVSVPDPALFQPAKRTADTNSIVPLKIIDKPSPVITKPEFSAAPYLIPGIAAALLAASFFFFVKRRRKKSSEQD